jgi:hypothetical protein
MTSWDLIGGVRYMMSRDLIGGVRLMISFGLIDYLRFYVPLKNFSLIWRCHHCR